jgi:hypothetical protein
VVVMARPAAMQELRPCGWRMLDVPVRSFAGILWGLGYLVLQHLGRIRRQVSS